MYQHSSSAFGENRRGSCDTSVSDLSETSGIYSRISDRSSFSKNQIRLSLNSHLISERKDPGEVTRHSTSRIGKKVPVVIGGVIEIGGQTGREKPSTDFSISSVCSRNLDDFIIFSESDQALNCDSNQSDKNINKSHFETVWDRGYGKANDLPAFVNEKKVISKRRRTVINFSTCLIVSLVVIMTMALGGLTPFSKSRKNIRENPHKTTLALMSYEELIQLLLPITPALHDAPSNAPQQQALNWLMTTQVPSLSKDRIMQRYILATFYYSTHGPHWKWKNAKGKRWLSNDHECDWSGVKCEDYVGNAISEDVVNTLDLHDMRLHGAIPIELGSLKDLDALFLQNNGLGGKIPDSIIELTELRKLNLADNQLSGGIPTEIGRMTKLEFLDLSSNKFQDMIPYGLGNLENLRHLDLSYNAFSREIPTELLNLKNLETLILDNNDIDGKIPHRISELRSLRRLSLSHNELFGTIPEEIGELANLEVLNLADNAFNGDVPVSLGEMSLITEIDLSKNKLNGKIPKTFKDLKKLQVLRLDHNEMSGFIPRWIGSKSSLTILTLHENSFMGNIPNALCDRKLNVLSGDCGGDSPKVKCSCCTVCSPEPVQQ